MPMNGHRLYRSERDRMLGGVAGGLAEYFDLDPALVRVAWAVLIIGSGGLFLLLYIVMWFVVPEAPPGYVSRSPWSSAAPQPDAAAAGAAPPSESPASANGAAATASTTPIRSWIELALRISRLPCGGPGNLKSKFHGGKARAALMYQSGIGHAAPSGQIMTPTTTAATRKATASAWYARLRNASSTR